MPKTIDKELLNILACPVCRSDLTLNKGKSQLICAKCKVNYPIKSGIPVLMPKKPKN